MQPTVWTQMFCSGLYLNYPGCFWFTFRTLQQQISVQGPVWLATFVRICSECGHTWQERSWYILALFVVVAFRSFTEPSENHECIFCTVPESTTLAGFALPSMGCEIGGCGYDRIRMDCGYDRTSLDAGQSHIFGTISVILAYFSSHFYLNSLTQLTRVNSLFALSSLSFL